MNAFIKIELKDVFIENFMKNDKRNLLFSSADKILMMLNSFIGFKTEIEYRISPVIDHSIIYDIKPYTNKQNSMNTTDLSKEKYEVLVSFCNNIPESLFRKNHLWLLRTMKTLLRRDKKLSTLDIKDMFEISMIINDKLMKHESLKVSFPETADIEYKVVKFGNDSTLRYLIDPYIEDHLLCVDYSKKLEEFDYFYNCLHMYEHYVTHAWSKSPSEHVKDINGSTYFNGICYVYTLSDDPKVIKDRLISSILFHIQSSDTSYIKKTNALSLETMRTISEAYTYRNLSRLGRSDQQAYTGEYAPDLFAYWSSLPMNILVITNSPMDINIDKINEFYKQHHKDAKQPEKAIFEYFPVEVHAIHRINSQHTFKTPIEKNVKKIYSNKNSKAFFGIDNKTVIYTNEQEVMEGKDKKLKKEDLSYIQTPLHPLLFMAKYADDKTVKKYINESVLPMSAGAFEAIPMNWLDKNNFNCMLDMYLEEQ